MNTEFYFLITWILFVRFALIFFEHKRTKSSNLARSFGFEVLGSFLLTAICLCVFSFHLKIAYIGLLLLIASVMRTWFIWMDIKKTYRYGLHFANIVIQIAIIGFFFTESGPPEFSQFFKETLPRLLQHHPFINQRLIDQIPLVWIFLSGWLFAANEVNLLIRFIIEQMALRPPEAVENTDQSPESDSFQIGRIIGALERTFIYFLCCQETSQQSGSS